MRHRQLGHVLLAIVLAASGTSTVLACGNWLPKHGGQMNHDGGEVAIELVQTGTSVVLHLEDHGMPILAKEAGGELKITRGSDSWVVPLERSDKNQLKGKLPRRLLKGDAIVADLAFKNGSIARGEFVFDTKVDLRTRFSQSSAPSFAAPPFSPVVAPK